ncbi:conserved hypothetical protein [Tenacibaculum sp. 190524A05c]|uniref:hypothetical protein n=1 Tax=Tenacibaculum platacis TaxID=3137852 RepID=UPI0031FB7884
MKSPISMETAIDEKIIFPPGITLSHNEQPILIPVSKSGHFTFENNYADPLPSLIEAKFNNDHIHVKMLFFVDSNFQLEGHNLVVNQLFSISNYGHPKLQFFLHTNDENICSELKNNPTTDGKYFAYTVKFKTDCTDGFPANINLEHIKIVQSFVWDIDPKTSRGTETTVQTTN